IVEKLGKDAEGFGGKSVLLAGACGFLGRYFLQAFLHMKKTVLAKNPVKVLALDNFITGDDAYEKMIDGHIRPQKHDIIQRLETSENFNIVVHAASIASPYYYRAHPLETLDVAVSGSRWMLDIANKNRANYIFFSSSEIYGDPDPEHIPIPESYRGNVS